MVLGNPYLFFVGILAVIVLFEYDFLTAHHTICDTQDDRRRYAELFCMARPHNMHSKGEGADLRQYGRWQFYIIVQIFIAAMMCKIDKKIRFLRSKQGPTIGKRYILTICSLLCIIGCWTLTYFSMGRYFNTFITRVIAHALKREPSISPINEVFPIRAQCTVIPPTGEESFTADCILPLNARTPYYYIALCLIYVLGLAWTTERLFELVGEKMCETRRCMRTKRPDIAVISKELNEQEESRQEWLNKFAKVEELINYAKLKVKYLSRPREVSSSQDAPLIRQYV